MITLDNKQVQTLTIGGKTVKTISVGGKQVYPTKVGAKPTNPSSVQYDGQSHTNGYVCPSGVTMTGAAAGTEIGTYSATYTPKDGYAWDDNTTNSVTVTLTIYSGSYTVTMTGDWHINEEELLGGSSAGIVLAHDDSGTQDDYYSSGAFTMRSSNDTAYVFVSLGSFRQDTYLMRIIDNVFGTGTTEQHEFDFTKIPCNITVDLDMTDTTSTAAWGTVRITRT